MKENNQTRHGAVAQEPSALDTEEFFRERANRANILKALNILRKAGKRNPAIAGDEPPQQ